MDDYYDDFLIDDFDDSDDAYGELPHELNQINLIDLFINCVQPTLIQILPYIGKLLLWCFICRIGWILVSGCYRSVQLRNLISILCGCLILYEAVQRLFLYLVVFNCTSYLILLFLVKNFRNNDINIPSNNSTINQESPRSKYSNNNSKVNIGLVLGSICFIVLTLWEFLQNDPKLWHQIRGTQMIFTMKSLSLAFDLNSTKYLKMPTFLEYSGYMFCPANCLFGPWVPYDEYKEACHSHKFNKKWLFWVFTNSFASIIFLLISNCFASMISYNWKWVRAYRDALSFRSSHYFISFVSQATMAAFGLINENDITSKTISPLFGLIVTKPWRIEFPRSLAQVVVYWNIPMHKWLKCYIFKSIKPYGNAAAIFITYLVSSLLHGLNFQLSAVLLSLGLYTFVEYNLRYKLGQIFNACILSVPCKNAVNQQHYKRSIADRSICKHTNKWSKPLVILSNFGFSLLTVFHLAYLGVMFEASTTTQEQGYSINHGLSKWQSLDFLSHWIVIFSYGFYFII